MKPGKWKVNLWYQIFFILHFIFNLHHKFCRRAWSVHQRVWFPYMHLKIIENKKSIFNTRFFYLHAMFNLQHKFLYVGTIYIPMCMICRQDSQNRKSFYNNRLFFICILYLTCTAGYYMWSQSVCSWVWLPYLWECFRYCRGEDFQSPSHFY